MGRGAELLSEGAEGVVAGLLSGDVGVGRGFLAEQGRGGGLVVERGWRYHGCRLRGSRVVE